MTESYSYLDGDFKYNILRVNEWNQRNNLNKRSFFFKNRWIKKKIPINCSNMKYKSLFFYRKK